MTESQNPEIETTEDVEGHAGSRNFIDGPDTESVEGHGRFNVIDGPDTDDVEGHAIGTGNGLGADRGISSGRFRPDEEEMFGRDDVEGHGLRGNIVEPEPQDVEGHTLKSHLVADDTEGDDTEGGAGAGR